MLMDLVQKAWKPLILIAIVSITITWVFNIQNTLITTEVINGIEIKRFNLYSYMLNISNAWQSNALNFEDILQDREWVEITASFVEKEFWMGIVNNMAYLFNWTYFPINFILWVLRWWCWLIKILLALIGWNTGINPTNDEYYSQLVRILVWITDNLMIPYV